MKKENMVTIPLSYPLTVDGTELKALVMRRPKVKDQLLAEKQSKTNAEKEICLLANLVEQSTDTIEEMDMADYRNVQKILSDFLLTEG